MSFTAPGTSKLGDRNTHVKFVNGENADDGIEINGEPFGVTIDGASAKQLARYILFGPDGVNEPDSDDDSDDVVTDEDGNVIVGQNSGVTDLETGFQNSGLTSTPTLADELQKASEQNTGNVPQAETKDTPASAAVTPPVPQTPAAPDDKKPGDKPTTQPKPKHGGA